MILSTQTRLFIFKLVNKTDLEMTVVELTDMDFSKAIMKINLKGF